MHNAIAKRHQHAVNGFGVEQRDLLNFASDQCLAHTKVKNYQLLAVRNLWLSCLDLRLHAEAPRRPILNNLRCRRQATHD
jgi:hypothetical protein